MRGGHRLCVGNQQLKDEPLIVADAAVVIGVERRGAIAAASASIILAIQPAVAPGQEAVSGDPVEVATDQRWTGRIAQNA